MNFLYNLIVSTLGVYNLIVSTLGVLLIIFI